MISHLTVCEHGSFLGTTGERLVVRQGDRVLAETPLNRLRSISIAKEGVSLSSNLVLACAARGIRIFFLDFSGRQVATLTGVHQHAVPAVRKAQFRFCEEPLRSAEAARAILYGKIRNQRAVLLYFSKYLTKVGRPEVAPLSEAEKCLDEASRKMQEAKAGTDAWRALFMGIEGSAARSYWQSLKEAALLPQSFGSREGRGADDVANQALNFGYAVLESRVWHCIANAGLEPFVGFLHVDRPGKPSLVLDLMEEYRPWVVDRSVIKIRRTLACKAGLDPSLKRTLVGEIQECLATRYPHHGKRLSLESILQRQIYALVGHMMEKKPYRPYLFKW